MFSSISPFLSIFEIYAGVNEGLNTKKRVTSPRQNKDGYQSATFRCIAKVK